MKLFELKSYCDVLLNVAAEGNRYININAPWNLLKNGDYAKMHCVLYTLIESLRRIAILLEPIIPDSSIKLLNDIGAKNNYMKSFESIDPIDGVYLKPGTRVELPQPIFPRIQK